jgi:hypothetical protein
MNRLSDDGSKLPTNPIGQTANFCRRHVDPSPGWAVGFLGRSAASGFRLPPDPVSTVALVSQVMVEGHHFGKTWGGAPVPLEGLRTTDPSYALATPSSEELQADD